MPAKKTTPAAAAPPQSTVKICSAPACTLPAVAKGLCPTHYRRFLRNGPDADLSAPIAQDRGDLVELKVRVPAAIAKRLEELARARGTSSYRVASQLVEGGPAAIDALKAITCNRAGSREIALPALAALGER